MIEPGKKFVQGLKKYRYSINGQEKETELNENITTAEYWEYDSRLGRRWNLDPKPTIGISDYSTFLNNPILHIDIKGDTPVHMYENFINMLKTNFGFGGKTISKLIPKNSTGDNIAGAVAGSGGAVIDIAKGAKQLVTHPINSIKSFGSFLFGNSELQALELSQQYLNFAKSNGSDFANSYLISYFFTSICVSKSLPSVTELIGEVSGGLKFTRFKGGGTYADFQGKHLGSYRYTNEKGLEFDLAVPKELQGKGLGTKIFSDAMKSTGAKKFTATWIESVEYETGASVNLQRYRAALKNSTATEAAWKTWSGQQAAANGFKNVSVKSIQGGTGVEATFTK